MYNAASKLSRLVRGVAVPALLISTLAGSITPAVAHFPNPIPAENAQTGSDKWELVTFLNEIPAKETLGEQEVVGYASDDSVAPGSTITFNVSVSPTRPLDKIEIYRLGFYGNKSGRLMTTLPVPPANTPNQPQCPLDSTTGRYECAWGGASALGFTVPTTWTTGVYIAKLYSTDPAKSAPNTFTSHVTFVVSDPARKADILFVVPTLSHAAYNNYPFDTVNNTGKGLFDFPESRGANTVSGNARAVKVSLDRPDILSYMSGFSLGNSDQAYDLHTVRWLERNGYNVNYATDIDVHENPQLLKQHSVVIVGSRAEYWTKELFDAFEQARDAGVHLAFIGGANGYWQVRLEPNSAGKPNRTVVGYKSAALDTAAPSGAQTTVRFRDTPVNRPEQTLVGVMQTYQLNATTTPLNYLAGYTVTNASHWAYAGLGLNNGDVITNIVGTTVDNLHLSRTKPVSTSYELIAISPFGAELHNSSIYTAPSGAMVWASGSLAWAWGLDRVDFRPSPDFDFVKPAVQRVTKNVLDRMIANAVPVHELVALSSSPTRLGDATAFTATLESGFNPTYTWSFGDNSATASGLNVSHLYSAAGTYTVVLTGTNAAGSVTSTVQVVVTNNAPIANAGSNQGATGGALVTLDGSASSDPDGHTPLTYLWTQTGGPAVTLSSPSAVSPTFTAPGTGVLTFTLMVTDAFGLSAATPAQVQVVIGSVAISGLSAQNSGPTLLGGVTALSATITAGSSVSYVWNFGDGSTPVSGQNVTKAYAAVGAYTATVTATNIVGSVVTRTVVVVNDVPVAGLNITTSTSAPRLNAATTFTAALSTGTGVTYSWSVSGPSSASGAGPVFSYTFVTPGTYTVTLTARNTSGTTTVTRQIIVASARVLLPLIGK